jgi:cell cycle sensor histidine kinase DivJ
MLKICVSDTGIGIAPDRIASLGQPFVQIQSDHSRRYEGTGLGLSLVKGLVALHGGSFGIASTPGHGTVITVLVPLDGTTLQASEDLQPVEFPPRLRSIVEHSELHNKEALNGPAEAKISA